MPPAKPSATKSGVQKRATVTLHSKDTSTENILLMFGRKVDRIRPAYMRDQDGLLSHSRIEETISQLEDAANYLRAVLAAKRTGEALLCAPDTDKPASD